MGKCAACILSIVLGFFPVLPVAAFDLTGDWTSGSGSIYHFVQKDRNVIATYASPNAGQAATGVKPGDVAFVGDVLGKVVSGTFHQRAPLQDRERCPATWYLTTDLMLVVNDDASVMEGPIMATHQNQQCQNDDRSVALVHLKRSAKP
jgi:hypothetical protein